jgi:RND family efflux transporter MFP subunit
MSTQPSELDKPANVAAPNGADGHRRIDSAVADPQSPSAQKPAKSSHRIAWRVVGLVAVIAILIPIWRGVTSHAKSRASAATIGVPRVAVVKANREDLSREVTIYAEFRPYLEVALRPKIPGYLQLMNVDIGDRVKSNQVLATLFVPELSNDLARATGVRMKTEADYTNAHKIYLRMAKAFTQTTNLIAQQDVDTLEANDHSTFAAIQSAKAEEDRYKTMLDYTQILAPFDGVITARYADPPAMIPAGTGSETKSLLQISDNYRLRLDFPVSVQYVKDIHDGDQVEVRVDSLGGKTFTGTITRSTDRVAMDTRTMITEIEVPNPKLELIPGMYAAVVLKVQRRPQALTVPIGAVAAGGKATVYVVNHSGQIEERPVTVGIETPTVYEVLAGLGEGDLVMIGSRTAVQPGEKVEPRLIKSLADEAVALGENDATKP